MRLLLFLVFTSLCSVGNNCSAGLKNEPSKDSVAVYIAEARTVVYNNFSEALPLLKKAETIAVQSQNPVLLGNVAYEYGNAYYVKGDYAQSLQYFLSAQEHYKSGKDEIGVAKAYIGQGLIQQGIDRHTEAVSFFRKSIEAYKKAGKEELANPSFLNIAISEIELHQLGNAKENLATAIRLSRIAKRKGVEHMATNQMGEVAYLEKEYMAAVNFYTQVLNDVDEPNSWEKSFSHSGLAKSFEALGDLEIAEDHADKALAFALEVESLWDLERNSEILARISAKRGNLQRAYVQLMDHQRYKDSLYDQMKVREINLMQLESKEAENAALLAKNEVAEKQLFINKIIAGSFISLSLFLLILLLLFKKNSRERNSFTQSLKEKNATILEQNKLISRRNDELDEANTAKNRLFSILAHDLRSPIGSIQQLLELIQSGEFTEKEKAGLLDEMLLQVSGTSDMLQNLLHWAASQLEGDKVEPEILQLSGEVDRVLQAHYLAVKQKQIQVNHSSSAKIPQVIVDSGHLSVILHNLISNAIKYTREGGKIEIFYNETEEAVRLAILDGGKGISEEKIVEISNFNKRMLSQIGTKMETGTGMGLLLVKQFLNLNDATLSIKNIPGAGAEFSVSFVKAKTLVNKLTYQV